MEKTYKAAVLSKFGEIPQITDLPLRKPNANEYLVKIMCTTIIPADLFNLQGQYGKYKPQLPGVIGFEGSGIIEDVGENLDKSVIGKHCSVVGQSSEKGHGTWSQYTYTNPGYIIIFDKPLEFDKIFSCFINPITIIGFLDVVKQKGEKIIAHNGSSTALGKMLTKLCLKENIEILNIVRKESTKEELAKLGAKLFVNTSNEGWEKELSELCQKHKIKSLFECVGGDMVGKCLSSIADGGVVYHYGNLSASQPSSFNTGDFIFKGKSLSGFWLGPWMASKKPEELLAVLNEIKNDFEKEEGIFSTDYREIFSLVDFEKALNSYNTKGGRVLIKPWN